jgi:hypothetical protein
MHSLNSVLGSWQSVPNRASKLAPISLTTANSSHPQCVIGVLLVAQPISSPPRTYPPRTVIASAFTSRSWIRPVQCPLLVTHPCPSGMSLWLPLSSVKVVSNFLPGEYRGLLCFQTSPVVQFGWVFPRRMWVDLLVFNKDNIKRKL